MVEAYGLYQVNGKNKPLTLLYTCATSRKWALEVARELRIKLLKRIRVVPMLLPVEGV